MAAKVSGSSLNPIKPMSDELLSTVAQVQEIRAVAQKIYENRLLKHLMGDENSDWYDAEAEVSKKHKTP
jgi:hypothetical protein